MSAGLYLHIPFCVRKCVYCDFVSCASSEDKKREYIDALIGEVGYAARVAPDVVDTIYIGGGTPSCLPRGELKRLSDAVFCLFDRNNVREFTAEANPESFDESAADEYLRCGVGRVSLGVQSTYDPVLRFLGRAHDFATARRAAALAAKSFDLNVDLMLGLPGQTESQVRDFVDFADSVGAAHISAYILKVESGTPLAARVAEGLTLPDDDACADLYDAFVDRAARSGYMRYETSNFAREGKRCEQNLKYWRMDDYIGVGVSAHGMQNMTRYFVPSDIDGYLERAKRGEYLREQEEQLTADAAADEMMMTGLRLDDGVDLCEIERRFGVSRDRYASGIAAASRYLVTEGDVVKIAPQYALVANPIIATVLPSDF